MGDLHVMRDDLRPPDPPPTRHLISIGDLSREDVERLLGTARTFERSLDREMKKLPTLRGRLVINVFYESSTRTSSSFELAAKRLSADTMSIKASGSSVDKGESLKDTAITLGAYDPDVIVLRHPQIGAPQLVARVTEARIVNAGDGKHQHPTQALLDLYTIQEQFGRIEGLHVAIVGDVLHSRVARSNIQALVLLGARVTLVGPPPLLPRGIEEMGCEATTDIDAIGAADVVYVLRMQKERMLEGANYVPSLREYTARWGVTPERLRPGPEGHAPGADEPRRRDRPARRGRGRRADRDAGARRARRADGSPLRPAHDRAEAGRGRSPDGGGVMLFVKDAPKENLIVRGARVLDPVEGLDTPGRREGRQRRDRGARVEPAAELAQGDRRDRARARAGLRRPARPPAHPRPRGRGDDRDRDSRRGRGRLLRDPRDAEHRAGRRHCCRPGRARRAGARRRRGAGRVPGRHLQGPGGLGADRDGRARRPWRGRVHRRRSSCGRDVTHVARAPVRVDHGPADRGALRGPDALARRSHARGSRLRGARDRRLAVDRRERDGRARPGAGALREPDAASDAPLGARLGGRASPGARGRRPRDGRGDAAPSRAHGRGGAHARPEREDEPAARGRGRPEGARRGAARRDGLVRRHRPRAARAAREGGAVRGGARSA